MLKLALSFLVISLIAGLFGFTGISAASAGIAKNPLHHLRGAFPYFSRDGGLRR